MTFSEQKVAQMAAYFLKLRGGRMAYLKLMKLLYLADRESLNRFDEPISHDQMVSMPHGPVLSQTYDLMVGQAERGWDEWIRDEANYEVSLKKSASRDDLDELSDVDLEVLDAVWNEFGSMSRWDLRDWTHNHCAEWEDPCGSSYPIAPKTVFRALGRSDSEAEERAQQLLDRRRLDRVLASYQ